MCKVCVRCVCVVIGMCIYQYRQGCWVRLYCQLALLSPARGNYTKPPLPSGLDCGISCFGDSWAHVSRSRGPPSCPAHCWVATVPALCSSPGVILLPPQEASRVRLTAVSFWRTRTKLPSAHHGGRPALTRSW